MCRLLEYYRHVGICRGEPSLYLNEHVRMKHFPAPVILLSATMMRLSTKICLSITFGQPMDIQCRQRFHFCAETFSAFLYSQVYPNHGDSFPVTEQHRPSVISILLLRRPQIQLRGPKSWLLLTQPKISLPHSLRTVSVPPQRRPINKDSPRHSCSSPTSDPRPLCPQSARSQPHAHSESPTD